MRFIGTVAIGTVLMGLGGCRPDDTEKVSASANKEVNQAVAQISALQQAKAVLLAATAYGNGHQNLLPGPKDYKNKVSPLLSSRDRAALDRFEWAFPGGDLTKMGDVAGVQLGRIRTVGGDAVAYGDGSVRWLKPQK